MTVTRETPSAQVPVASSLLSRPGPSPMASDLNQMGISEQDSIVKALLPTSYSTHASSTGVSFSLRALSMIIPSQCHSKSRSNRADSSPRPSRKSARLRAMSGYSASAAADRASSLSMAPQSSGGISSSMKMSSR